MAAGAGYLSVARFPAAYWQIPTTGFGVVWSGGVVPRHPLLFNPQHRMSPDAIRAQVCSLPAATAATPLSTSLAGGVVRSVWVPSPSWPKMLRPQQRTPPVVISAQL